jgi:hypothetical protein
MGVITVRSLQSTNLPHTVVDTRATPQYWVGMAMFYRIHKPRTAHTLDLKKCWDLVFFF